MNCSVKIRADVGCDRAKVKIIFVKHRVEKVTRIKDFKEKVTLNDFLLILIIKYSLSLLQEQCSIRDKL